MHSFGETQQPPDGISGSTSQDMKQRFLQRMFYLSFFFFEKKTQTFAQTRYVLGVLCAVERL